MAKTPKSIRKRKGWARAKDTRRRAKRRLGFGVLFVNGREIGYVTGLTFNGIPIR